MTTSSMTTPSMTTSSMTTPSMTTSSMTTPSTTTPSMSSSPSIPSPDLITPAPNASQKSTAQNSSPYSSYSPESEASMMNPAASGLHDGALYAALAKDIDDSIVAVFANHQAAESAVKKLAEDGFAMKHLTVIGKGYHTEEKVVGFYNIGDRVKFWGGRGAFWGGLWGLFFGGVFLTTPLIGPVIVLGYTASIIIAAFESAILVGGLSALGAALYSIGIPKDSVIQYEADIKAERFLVMVHGAATEVDRARIILGKTGPSKIDVHLGGKFAGAKI